MPQGVHEIKAGFSYPANESELNIKSRARIYVQDWKSVSMDGGKTGNYEFQAVKGLRHVINETGDWSRVCREHLQ